MANKIVTLIAVGTRGDVQPYIALGKGLRLAGLTVRLVTTPDFRSLVMQHGLEFHQIFDMDVEAVMQSDESKAILEIKNPLTMLRRLVEFCRPWYHKALDSMLEALDGAEVGIFSSVAQFGGYEACEKLNIPAIFTYLQPVVPMKEVSSPFFPAMPAIPGQAIYNRLTHHISIQTIWQLFRPIVNDARANRLGLAKLPLAGSWSIIKGHKLPVMMGYSPHVVAPSTDWHEAISVPGYWFLDQPDDWSPPPDLEAFLTNGEPPIYIGFGSMANRNPERNTQIVLDALERSGERGLLSTGWGGLQNVTFSDNFFKIESCPHSWLFPRMKAIVHHGGAGTTAAAFRAGKPQIVVPFFADQPFWGRMTQKLGVGVKPIPNKIISSELLASAIQHVSNSHEIQQNATELGEKVRGENGVANAVEIIKRILA